ncbi:zinc-binding dehydrogenase [Kitasatospora sp. MAP5-34]|uniref:quinone oxidoreductase family protein n=1 Tax=Kitasatospora sp. MAP5-34 TaxID=3035102 RepID=UPI002473EE12|nr:zinc-binding dehydrogenase [Kitasatospora sp. MAP5-34]MDH6579230.1 NADPH2:quinone reductase [Kitasatospora sp. MAP5-34]
MRAVRYTRTGGPEVLETADIPVPQPGPGEVAIDVSHAGVHFADVMFRRGQFPLPLPAVPGLEVAGTVAVLGEGVTGLRVGQPVAAVPTGFGGYAERVIASELTTVPLEGELAGLTPLLAAATACNAATAVGTLRGAARITEGDRVLVLGASGALGALLGGLARAYGAALVVGAASTPERAARAAGGGCHQALTYGELADRTPELTDGQGFDVVIDSVGGEPREQVRGLLAVLGRHVVIGNAADQDITLDANQVWYDSFTLAGYNMGGVLARRPDLFRAHLEEGLRLVADGTLRIDVEEIGWDGVVKAHELLEGRAATGKYVLRTV